MRHETLIAQENDGRQAWARLARPKQCWPPGAWRIWLLLAGRGFGKTRTGAETVRQVAAAGVCSRIALVGETAADVRQVMIEGPDGVLACSPPAERPVWQPALRRLVWPNGVVGAAFAGCDPDQLRGPQHGFAWVDELAKFPYVDTLWANLMLGLRVGTDPRCLVTTTPRPLPLLRALVRRDGADVVVVRGSTFENAANLPPAFTEAILARYEGTTLARQELYAELLDEHPGALWQRALLDRYRVAEAPVLSRIVVGVDPSVSEHGEGDACGIVACGIDGSEPPVAYVLADATTRGAPAVWAGAVAALYGRLRANLVVAEGNQGGALVAEVLRMADPSMPVEIVHARHGKSARAEPVAMLYAQGRVRHAGGFGPLEDELTTWTPGCASPNRLDALVWAVTALLLRGDGRVDAEIF